VFFCRLGKTIQIISYFKSMILVFFCRLGKTRLFRSGLDITFVCPIPVKTDVGQVDLVSRLFDGTSEKMTVLPFEGYFL
jgi:hypothetical protein